MGICPVEDLASDIDLNLWCQKYLRAKSLYHLTEDPKTQQGVFEELGLYDNPDFHLRIEGVYAKYLAKNRMSTVRENKKWNKIL